MGKNACSAAVNHGTSQSTLKALEFYSGIGGMHCAVERACKAGHIPAVEVLAAFDINPVANSVYEHNFGHIVRRVCTISATWLWQVLLLGIRHVVQCSHPLRALQNNIEAVPLQHIDGYAAQLWMLAPPCQPYTRQVGGPSWVCTRHA